MLKAYSTLFCDVAHKMGCVFFYFLPPYTVKITIKRVTLIIYSKEIRGRFKIKPVIKSTTYKFFRDKKSTVFKARVVEDNPKSGDDISLYRFFSPVCQPEQDPNGLKSNSTLKPGSIPEKGIAAEWLLLFWPKGGGGRNIRVQQWIGVTFMTVACFYPCHKWFKVESWQESDFKSREYLARSPLGNVCEKESLVTLLLQECQGKRDEVGQQSCQFSVATKTAEPPPLFSDSKLPSKLKATTFWKLELSLIWGGSQKAKTKHGVKCFISS